MSDNRKKRGKHDRIRVNVNQPHEVRHWRKAFGVTSATLRAAVFMVGPMVKDVRAALIERIKNAK